MIVSTSTQRKNNNHISFDVAIECIQYLKANPAIKINKRILFHIRSAVSSGSNSGVV